MSRAELVDSSEGSRALRPGVITFGLVEATSAMPSRRGDTRPDLLAYTVAYAYRPRSWRTDTGWDWRIFGELTGERSGRIERRGATLPGTDSHQLFLGPTTLGVYKNYAVSAGIQFPVYRAVSPVYGRERFRWSVNVAYFF